MENQELSIKAQEIADLIQEADSDIRVWEKQLLRAKTTKEALENELKQLEDELNK